MKKYLVAALLVASCKNELEPCVDGVTSCEGNVFQVCEGGFIRQIAACSEGCDPNGGCLNTECDPSLGASCVGDERHECNPDGTIGDVIETCGPGQCRFDGCDSISSNCAVGTELIYLVDSDNSLFSFDPILLNAGQNAFVEIGSLNCPAGAPLGGFPSPSSPFSMSVDRQGIAWVLYTSGQLFQVNIANANCQATNFVVGQQGFEHFGMGFVADASGSDQETLYIAGGPAERLDIGDLASIDTNTLQVTPLGALPNDPANSPELTGSGNGDLFGFYPGDIFIQSQIAQLNKTNGVHLTTNNFDAAASGTLIAWAFAFFAGDFYLFTTTDNGFGTQNSQVSFFDGQTQQVSVKLSNLPNIFVGAGVSTCAPLVIE
jgi:hypothetical protein